MPRTPVSPTSVLASTLAIVGRELVLVEPVAVAPVRGRKADGAIHFDDPAGPAGRDHAGHALNFAISAAARSGSTLMLMVCSPARSASQVTARLAQGHLDVLSLQAFQEIRRRVQLDPHPDRFRRHFGKILRRGGDAVIGGLVVLKFLFAEVGIVGRGHFRHGLADADLALEFESFAGRLSHQLHRDRQFVAEALGGAGQGLAVDREIGDEAILAVGALCRRDSRHRAPRR